MVPEEFLRYQWTQLKHGVPSSQFVEQVTSLLKAPKKGPGSRAPVAPATAAAEPAARPPDPLLPHASADASHPGGGRGRLSAPPARRSPQEVARLLAAATSPRRWQPPPGEKRTAEAAPPAAPDRSDKSVAVLPFENMSEDKDNNAFFADGVHEDILTNLALHQGLQVVSRTSVMQYRGHDQADRRDRAASSAWRTSWKGSVRRAGNKVRVTGQLIRAATDEHIWAKAYDRDITDVFAIQGELAQAIAGALQRGDLARRKSRCSSPPTTMPTPMTCT